MKKIHVLLLVVVILFSFAGCSSGVSQEEYDNDNNVLPEIIEPVESGTPSTEPDSKVEDAETPENKPLPQVTYDEIKTGEYDNQIVQITCAVSQVEKGVTDYIGFTAWVGNTEQYVYDGEWLVFDLNEEVEKAILKEMKDGEVYSFQIEINEDSSFGGTGIVSAEKLPQTVDVSELVLQYKDSCVQYTCEELLRYTDEYYGKNAKFTGSVLQIIEAGNTLLLDTGEEHGPVYVYYYRIDETDGRILEGDEIVVYGTFYKLTQYTSLLGTEKTVPELHAQFLERI